MRTGMEIQGDWEMWQPFRRLSICLALSLTALSLVWNSLARAAEQEVAFPL